MSIAEPDLGSEIVITCWHCSLCLMRLRIEVGVHLLKCTRCALVTKVTVSREGTTLQIRSGQG